MTKYIDRLKTSISLDLEINKLLISGQECADVEITSIAINVLFFKQEKLEYSVYEKTYDLSLLDQGLEAAAKFIYIDWLFS